VVEPPTAGDDPRLANVRCHSMLLFAIAVVIVALCAVVGYGYQRSAAALASQSTAIEALERRVGRITDKVSSGNHTIRDLIDEVAKDRKVAQREIRQHHSKLDRMLSRLRVYNGSVTARGSKPLPTHTSDDDNEDSDVVTQPQAQQTANSTESEEEDDDDDDEDGKEEKHKKKRGKGKKRRKHG